MTPEEIQQEIDRFERDMEINKMSAFPMSKQEEEAKRAIMNARFESWRSSTGQPAYTFKFDRTQAEIEALTPTFEKYYLETHYEDGSITKVPITINPAPSAQPPATTAKITISYTKDY